MTVKILFLGNSYTSRNDLPGLLTEIAREHGVEISADQVTKGGCSFAHYASPVNAYGNAFRALLRQNRYDFVVLQEQSLRPAQSPQTFINGLEKLLVPIRANGAEPVLYQTWARADGHKTLTEHGWTHEQMQQKLCLAYREAAERFNLRVVPAGERFHEAYRRGEAVFADDGSHPSPLGSRIAAQTFFEALFLREKCKIFMKR